MLVLGLQEPVYRHAHCQIHNKSAFYLGNRETSLSSAYVMEYYLTLTINHIYFRTPPLELITKPEIKLPANLPGKGLSNEWVNPWDSINPRKLSLLRTSTPQVVKSITSHLNDRNQGKRFHLAIGFRIETY